MDWKLAMETERVALEGVVALLLALADLAECAGGRSQPVRYVALRILLRAEALARSLVTGTTTPIPLRQAGSAPSDALRLAQDFRDLALELHHQAVLAFAAYGDESEQNEAARFGVRRALLSVPGIANALTFLTSSRDTPRFAVFPDTS